MSNEKVVQLAEIEPWNPKQFKSMDKTKAAELFMGVAQVPADWNRVYFIGDEDFQIAMHCVNASIAAAREVSKPPTRDNSVTVSFCTS